MSNYSQNMSQICQINQLKLQTSFSQVLVGAGVGQISDAASFREPKNSTKMSPSEALIAEKTHRWRRSSVLYSRLAVLIFSCVCASTTSFAF